MSKILIAAGGQLGLMLGQAAKNLGFECIFLDTSTDACAKQVGQIVVTDFSHNHLSDIGKVAATCEYGTVEWENVPLQVARAISENTKFSPSLGAVATAQDRIREKYFFRRHSLPATNFKQVTNATTLYDASTALGFPLILKTNSGGYDGKGQFRIEHEDELVSVWEKLVKTGKGVYIAEKVVNFERELSLVSSRDCFGNIVFYPLIQNYHKDGILRLSIAPAPESAAIEIQAQEFARIILEKLGYVGTLTLEFFQVGELLILNEMANRVHNSGHWTIEGSSVSQFQNHIRAVTSQEVIQPYIIGHCAMVNILGLHPEDELPEPWVIHIYGKEERPGRKLGHYTLVADTPEGRNELLKGSGLLEMHGISL